MIHLSLSHFCTKVEFMLTRRCFIFPLLFISRSPVFDINLSFDTWLRTKARYTDKFLSNSCWVYLPFHLVWTTIYVDWKFCFLSILSRLVFCYFGLILRFFFQRKKTLVRFLHFCCKVLSFNRKLDLHIFSSVLVYTKNLCLVFSLYHDWLYVIFLSRVMYLLKNLIAKI